MKAMQSEPEPQSVLVADDDPGVRTVVAESLREAGFRVLEARNGRQVLDALEEAVSVALFDLDMPEPNGMECIQHIQRRLPEAESIVITGSRRVSDAVEAMKRGAFDYLTKPLQMDEVVALVGKAAGTSRLRRENRQLKDLVGLPRRQSSLVGQSDCMQEVVRLAGRVAPLDSTVLLTGESGVGKSLVARMIHNLGPHSEKPLVTVSCTALPRELVEAELFGYEKGAFTGAAYSRPGKIEVAQGGTLLLDEIGDMPLDTQPKLLTFLQERTVQRIGSRHTLSVDVRVIAATNQDLKALCREKRFREDLFFRLYVLPIHIAPLRQRIEDIPLLAEHLLAGISRRRGGPAFRLGKEALEALSGYRWPGNVRELENVLERATAFSDSRQIGLQDLSPEVRGEQGAATAGAEALDLAGMTLAEIEEAAITQTLQLCRGNKTETARLLGVSQRTIYNKVRELGIEAFGAVS